MKKVFFLLVLVCSTGSLFAQNKESDSLVSSSIMEMEEGNFEKSKTLLEDVIKKDPYHYGANYELAYLYAITRQYDKGIELLNKIEKSEEVSDRYYQLLGSLYDYKGMKSLAIVKFEEGIKKFPNSGRLYVELGMMYHGANDVMTALENYEKGILADPMFPSNYYYAGLILLGSSEPVWGLMYGEIFMNLEPYTDRSKTMSNYLYETITSNVVISDTAIIANLTSQNSLEFNQLTMSLEMPFPLLYQICFNAAGKKAVEEGFDSLELFTLGKLHEYQMEHGKAYYDIKYNDPLYLYQLKIMNAGFMEDYCMLLYKGGSPEDYVGWMTMNKEHYLSFMEWREKNPLQLTQENCFSRLTCKPITFN